MRWCLLAPVVELEGARGLGCRPSQRRASSEAAGSAPRSLVGVSAVVALAAGPLLGVALIFTTSMPFVLLNIVAGVVYTLLLPFVALVTSYVYFDARVHGELEPADLPSELPAEIAL